MRILIHTFCLDRTGSSIALLNLLIHCQERGIYLMSELKGELEDQLPEYIKSKAFSEFYYGASYQDNTFINKIKYKIGFETYNSNYRKRFIEDTINKFDPNVCLINGININNEYIIRYCLENSIPTVLYSHDIEPAFYHSTKQYLRLLPHLTKCIACSNIAAERLETLGCQNISILPPSIEKLPDSSIITNGKTAYDIIPDDAFVWGMSGYADFNKNPILFLNLCEEVVKVNPRVFFLWIGADLQTGQIHFCERLATKKGVSSKLLFIGKQRGDEYYSIMKRLDGFVLMSQFDSFPIVTLEALSLKIPVVLGNNAGTSELITKERGIVVKEYCLNAYKRAVLDVMSNYTSFSNYDNSFLDDFKPRKMALHFNDILRKVVLNENCTH